MSVKCDYPRCGRAENKCGVCDYTALNQSATASLERDLAETRAKYERLQADFRARIETPSATVPACENCGKPTEPYCWDCERSPHTADSTIKETPNG